ncbi:hypothetical protein BDV32DRAFT_128995 [Aspergillus pseudonomiae]|nr:hypothetical protein BDV32DRAFT_128995 [Aspergillus pseudonomiae]
MVQRSLSSGASSGKSSTQEALVNRLSTPQPPAPMDAAHLPPKRTPDFTDFCSIVARD